MKNILFFALLTMALITSCEKSLSPDFNLENQTNLESIAPALNTQLAAASANGLGGAQVVRSEFDWGFLFIDDKTQNVAWVNLDRVAFCQGERIRDMVDVLEVIRQEKDGTERIKTLFKGRDVEVIVYDRYYFCEDIINAEPIFKGTGSFVWNDNDVVPDGKNANSWGFNLQGDGISIRFHAVNNGKNNKETTSIKLD